MLFVSGRSVEAFPIRQDIAMPALQVFGIRLRDDIRIVGPDIFVAAFDRDLVATGVGQRDVAN